MGGSGGGVWVNARQLFEEGEEINFDTAAAIHSVGFNVHEVR